MGIIVRTKQLDNVFSYAVNILKDCQLAFFKASGSQ